MNFIRERHKNVIVAITFRVWFQCCKQIEWQVDGLQSGHRVGRLLGGIHLCKKHVKNHPIPAYLCPGDSGWFATLTIILSQSAINGDVTSTLSKTRVGGLSHFCYDFRRHSRMWLCGCWPGRDVSQSQHSTPDPRWQLSPPTNTF